MARLEIIMQNPELAACRDELEEMGYSADLGLAGLARLGIFKMRCSPAMQQCWAEMSQRIASNPVFIIRHYMNTTIFNANYQGADLSYALLLLW